MKKTSALILAGLLCIGSFTACASSAPAPEQADTGVPKSKGKMVVAISEEQKEFFGPAVGKYCKLHPETEIEIEIIPFIDNQPTEKMEKNRKTADDMQVQVLAGKGPDVFLLDESDSLLPDMVKSSYNGVFLDLNTVIDGIKGLPLNQTVVKAGEVDGKQYFLPLGYRLAGIAVADDTLGDFQPSSGQPDKFLKEVAAHAGVESFRNESLMKWYLPGLFGTPVLDYEEKSVTVSKELQDMAELLEEGSGITDENAPELPDIMTVGDSDDDSFAMLVEGSFASGTDIKFLPFPNGEGGVNAQVSIFAAVRANSAYAAQAGEFLAFLLSDEMQSGSDAFHAIPVNNNAVVPAYQDRFTFGSEEYEKEAAKKAEELFQITQQVTTARFCQYENSLLYKIVSMGTENGSIEEKLEDMVMKKAKKYMVTMSKGKETVLEMPEEGQELKEYEEPLDEEKEKKAKRLQYLLQHMVTDAVKSANQEMCTEIKESILKELDYQFRQQEERDEERRKLDEEHYRKIDEMISQRRRPGEKFGRGKKKEPLPQK